MKGVRCDWNDDVHVVNSWATWTSPLQSQRIDARLGEHAPLSATVA